jgi:hypothetical protein
MSNDTRRILEMVSQGKISVQEADELLAAVAGAHAEAAAPVGSEKKEARWLRISIDKQGDGGRHKEVNMRVPVSIVRAGVRLSALMPQGIHVSRIDPKQLEQVISSMGEMVIDVDNGRARVRIGCE